MIRKRMCNSESNSFVAAANKCVFSMYLNTDSDEADVTSHHSRSHSTLHGRHKVVAVVSQSQSHHRIM